MGEKKYNGVFDTAEEACLAAEAAQKKLMSEYTKDDRQRMIDNIKLRGKENIEKIAKLEWEETGYGRYEDKIAQLQGNFANLPGTDAVETKIYAGSKGITMDVYAPFGVVGAVTPVTNVSSTLMGNSVCNLAVGNSVVFNVHPAGVETARMIIDIINSAIIEVGGPADLYTMPAVPTMQTLDTIVHYPAVRLISGTGGPAMVATLMSSGKRVIAAGPGNPPCVVDSSADIKRAVEQITACAAFNNNIFCIAEKEIFVVADVYDEFLKEMEDFGLFRLTSDQAAKLVEQCLRKNPEGAPEGYSPNKKYVGKNANVILNDAGIDVDGDPRLAFFEAENDNPFVQTEQMMPILPIVKCDTFEQACERALYAEHGNHHSASVWTKDLYHATTFAKLINTTVCTMNGNTMSAYGNGGEGTDTPTTATPTGEGVTKPATFARCRRFAMADGQGFPV